MCFLPGEECGSAVRCAFVARQPGHERAALPPAAGPGGRAPELSGGGAAGGGTAHNGLGVWQLEGRGKTLFPPLKK